MTQQILEKEITYSESTVGRDPKNPLCDILKEDEAYLYGQLIRAMGIVSDANQRKGGAWEDLTKRCPKLFSKGKNGPNSIFSILAGILSNYHENLNQYGICRLSKKQMDDLEVATLLLNAHDNTFPKIKFKQSLFEIAGVVKF